VFRVFDGICAAGRFRFAVQILRLVRALGHSLPDRVMARQIARSSTSVGANLEEAQASHSKADFARRMKLARAEARETLYWLRLLSETQIVPRAKPAPLIREADEIIRILVAIVKTSRSD
jgi:four helix bundle protein